MFKVWEMFEKTSDKPESELLSEIVEFIIKTILGAINQKQKFEELRPLAGNIKFETYRKEPTVKRVEDE